MPKGDALAVARIAGIMAAKKTPELVPLCHPLMISGVDVLAEVTDDGVSLTATVKTNERTGVEMEALTAVSVAGLAVVDMVKAIDRDATITDVRVVAKSGGRSGDYRRAGEAATAARVTTALVDHRVDPRLGRGLRGPFRSGARRRAAGVRLRGRRARRRPRRRRGR